MNTPKDSTAERTPGSLHPAGSASFLRAAVNDVTVAMMLRQEQPLEAIIGQLASEKEQYVKRIMELESIAPRKIVMPDGKVMLWQCPAELVPPMMPNGPRESRLRAALEAFEREISGRFGSDEDMTQDTLRVVLMARAALREPNTEVTHD